MACEAFVPFLLLCLSCKNDDPLLKLWMDRIPAAHLGTAWLETFALKKHQGSFQQLLLSREGLDQWQSPCCSPTLFLRPSDLIDYCNLLYHMLLVLLLLFSFALVPPRWKDYHTLVHMSRVIVPLLSPAKFLLVPVVQVSYYVHLRWQWLTLFPQLIPSQ